MSLKKTSGITCPRCGSETQVEVWNPIFVQLDPEAKERGLEGKLNRFTCDRCGMEGPLGTRLLYHDGANEFVVWFCPFGKMDAEFLDMFTETGEYRDNSASLY